MSTSTPEHLDVLIIGAGLSGIGAAYHLKTFCPTRTYAILESREAIGGTWDLFRYPGIRSDSDMFTLGYRFRPWRDGRAIADGPSIKAYIEETAAEHGITDKIRFRHRVMRAEWSSADARWHVTAEVGPERTPVHYTCKFLYTCTGYYDYASGYTPEFPGRETFRGQVVHPQHWPDDLDYEGKRVVVIGSGATAITLVPAMAEKALHVTMLQRSPTYIASLPGRDAIAGMLRRLLPDGAAYAATRWKNVLVGMFFYDLARKRPGVVKHFLRKGARRSLGEDFDVDKHFKPRYEPWDERVCVAPDGDFFRAIRKKRASVVTDTIDTFTETGIRLSSGEHLDADIIVTATGLNAKLFAGLELFVDGERVDLAKSTAYKGMMYSDVPNLASAVGYTNASWTLKCDLIAEHVVRILNHMRDRGYDSVTPRVRDASMPTEPLIGLRSGYVKRALHTLPKQGTRAPWRLHQNYVKDLYMLRFGRVDEPELEFERARTGKTAPSREHSRVVANGASHA
ncbi:monooxygenase, flavin-binding family [Labilithrix luteola]|uniref:Monooxygenase, flavin-binding family n=1 Tax=Labilithrix luteola TaxID=1391654 RepID=A0A0K1QGB2_9BACT|nr:NAD(P)/FAD-dependent oxidoreductase [Labilithrix luteola]AKV04475.1 monooxygenase, flavin-binding family [Labilithrix luteola]